MILCILAPPTFHHLGIRVNLRPFAVRNVVGPLWGTSFWVQKALAGYLPPSLCELWRDTQVQTLELFPPFFPIIGNSKILRGLFCASRSFGASWVVKNLCAPVPLWPAPRANFCEKSTFCWVRA